MDKKKLIGTIIGVAMFAALIAGATFAYLSFTATVTNTIGTANTIQFIVDYTQGTDVTNLPMLQNSAATPSNTPHLVVKAKKNAKSADGKVTIYLNSLASSSDFVSASAVKAYACKGACTSFTSGNIKTATSNKITLYTDSEKLTSSDTSYYVYFWLDAEKITNQHLDKKYEGYISASATQVE